MQKPARSESSGRTSLSSGSRGVEDWIKELTGIVDTRTRSAREWEAVLHAVVSEYSSRDADPRQQESRWLILDEITHRALAPAAGSRRAALEKALIGRWKQAADLDERVFLLRQLALVGGEDSVSLLASLLESSDDTVRQYALRALEEIPHPGSGKTLLAAFKKGGAEQWRLALATALGSRADSSLRVALRELHADEKEAAVKEVLTAAISRVEE